MQENADNETAGGESDLGGMRATVPQPPRSLAGIFKSSRKRRFMFTLASFAEQTRTFDKRVNFHSATLSILAWILFFLHLSSAPVTQAAGLVSAADSSASALL